MQASHDSNVVTDFVISRRNQVVKVSPGDSLARARGLARIPTTLESKKFEYF